MRLGHIQKLGIRFNTKFETAEDGIFFFSLLADTDIDRIRFVGQCGYFYEKSATGSQTKRFLQSREASKEEDTLQLLRFARKLGLSDKDYNSLRDYRLLTNVRTLFMFNFTPGIKPSLDEWRSFMKRMLENKSKDYIRILKDTGNERKLNVMEKAIGMAFKMRNVTIATFFLDAMFFIKHLTKPK